MWSRATQTKNAPGNVISDTLTRNYFAWRDSAITTMIEHDKDYNGSSFAHDWTTIYTHQGGTHGSTGAGLGALTSAQINDGRARTIAFTNDENGQIIRRDEGTFQGQSSSNQTGNPHEVWYRYGGRQLGYTGNNGTSKVDIVASI